MINRFRIRFEDMIDKLRGVDDEDWEIAEGRKLRKQCRRDGHGPRNKITYNGEYSKIYCTHCRAEMHGEDCEAAGEHVDVIKRRKGPRRGLLRRRQIICSCFRCGSRWMWA